jgi:hypothetical protein
MDDAREVLHRSSPGRGDMERGWNVVPDAALPYRTVTNTIGGIILTFSEVTAISRRK